MGLLADLQGFDEEVADVMVNNLYDLQKKSRRSRSVREQKGNCRVKAHAVAG